MIPTQNRVVPINGTRIHFRELFPRGTAPTVMVLHGIMGHCREWDALAEMLAGTYRVVTVDQRGHGHSQWAHDYSPMALANDLVALVETTQRPPVHVVAHSMGGIAAMLAAASRPDLFGRLVIVDIGPDSIANGSPAIAAFVDGLGRASYGSFQEAYAEWAGNQLARPDLLRHYVAHCLRTDPDGRLRWRFDGTGLRHFFESASPGQVWKAVDAIASPVLVVRGEQSPVLAPAEATELASRLTRGSLVTVAKGGHDLGVEQPEAVARQALAFFGPHPAGMRQRPSISPSTISPVGSNP